MSWQIGLLVVVFIACVAPWLFCAIADRFGADDDWDHVAEQKRRTAKKARHMSGEFR